MASRDAAARGYFQQLFDRSAEATGERGSRECRLQVAGRQVSLLFANPEFDAVILPALRHLESASVGKAELAIHLWDSATTGFDPPRPPWQVPTGGPWIYRSDALRATNIRETNSIIVIDHARGEAVFWTADVKRLPIVERGSPLLRLWAWWLGKGEVQFTHAAALGNDAGAALLLGPGGSGKSTTALQSLQSPLYYLGDDYCLIRSRPGPAVFSLYSSGKVNASERERFPWLENTFAGLDAEKALFQLYPAFADRIAKEKPLTVLLACRVTGQPDSSIEPLSSAMITRMSAPSTVVQLHSIIDAATGLRTMAELAQHLPAFRLNLGLRRDRIPELIAELLNR